MKTIDSLVAEVAALEEEVRALRDMLARVTPDWMVDWREGCGCAGCAEGRELGRLLGRGPWRAVGADVPEGGERMPS